MLDGVDQASREGVLLSRLQGFRAHTDQLDCRHGAQLDSVRQLDEPVFAALDVVATLEARCRGAEHDARARGLSTQNGDVATVIPRGVLLLVATVMLLIDNDQAKALDG